MSDLSIISVVDDDDSVRAMICGLVRSLGFKARSFASAEAFLQSADLAETACLIADVHMPNMTGIELQRALIEQGFRTPVILYTGFPDEETEKRAMTAGAIGFLHKPFDGEDMVHCIDRAIGQINRSR